MKDQVIIGNGTSRNVKTATLPDNYSDFKTAMENGTVKADFTVNNSGCEEVGTPLNKANLLSDTTANALGVLGDDPTVNDAFYQVANGKVNSVNPVSSGTFSHGRKASTTVGTGSVVIGDNAEASNTDSIAMGNQAQTQGQSAVAIGYKAKANNNYCVSIGNQNTASGNASITMGFGSVATNNNCILLGYKLNSPANTSVILGQWNATHSSIKFAVGSGSNEETRRNSLALNQSGDLHIRSRLFVNDTSDACMTGGTKLTIDSGDTMSIPNSTYCFGFISNSSKDIFFMLPTDKTITASTITCNNMTVTIRGVGGYIGSSNTPFSTICDSSITITKTTSGISIHGVASSTIRGATNNTPIVVQVAGTFVFS